MSPTTVPRAAAQAPESAANEWPLERILFLLAGTMTALSAVLAAVVSPWFLLLTGFVAANQLLFVAVGNCPSSWVLRHYFGVKAAGER
jgi:Flp pilus assembly protein TadB